MSATLELTVPAHRRDRRGAQVEIVIPVFNEEGGLEASIRHLHAYLERAFPLRWLITIADNASTDQTWAIACRLTQQLDGVQAIHLAEKGRGRALRTAWTASDAPVVAYMDVDLSTDLDALLPLVAPLLSGHSDVAIGTRLAVGARVVRGPKREAISRTYNFLLKAVLRSGFSDAQCGFKAVRSEVAKVLVPMVEDQGWFFDTELLVLAEHNGLRIHEVPVDWVDDPDSRVDVVRTARADLQGVWRMIGSTVTGRASVPAETVVSRLRPVRADAALAPDLGSQLVRFASIGLVSTVLFAVLFSLLVRPFGPFVADVVALGVCTVANTAANRRLTFATRGRSGRTRHYFAGLALAALPLVLTLATLAVLEALGVTSLAAQLVALTLANLVASASRFTLLRSWVFRPQPASDPPSPSPGASSTGPGATAGSDVTGATRAAPSPFGRRTAIGRRLRQLVRYGAVSAIATTTSLTVLGTLVFTGLLTSGWANLVATAVGTVPSFELNRRWVWGKRGRRSAWTEVGPFVALSFAGLGLSTIFVALAAHWADASALDQTMRTVAVEAASILAFGSLWLLQFVILDRFLFGRGATRPSVGAPREVPEAPAPDLASAA
jgi:putative flippase GtrA